MAIWVKLLLPWALKSCPKYNKSPNLVTLAMRKNVGIVKQRERENVSVKM